MMYMKEKWVDTMYQSMKFQFPDMDAIKLRKYIEEIFDKNFVDNESILYNNYEQTIADTSLSQVVDWFQSDKPLICESGVYFIPKHLKRNVNAEIVRENMLNARSIAKKEMFECLEIGDEFGAAVKNIQQMNFKKAANSQFGAAAEPSSFLYNLHTAMSITSCGRGQLSTACQCIENLFADNVKFFNMDEFFTWITNILSEKDDWKFDVYEIINNIPNKSRFVKRFIGKFYHKQFAKIDMIENVYDSLSEKERIRVYYKANIYEFLMNVVPANIYSNIGSFYVDPEKDTDPKNPLEFVDPNKMPLKMAPKIQLLVELVTEFVTYKHSIFRYEDRTRYQKRKVIIVMDTDSEVYIINIYGIIKLIELLEFVH